MSQEALLVTLTNFGFVETDSVQDIHEIFIVSTKITRAYILSQYKQKIYAKTLCNYIQIYADRCSLIHATLA